MIVLSGAELGAHLERNSVTLLMRINYALDAKDQGG
jgi:hypothetical protein